MYGDRLMNDTVLSSLCYSSFPPRYFGLHATVPKQFPSFFYFLTLGVVSLYMMRYTVPAPYLETYSNVLLPRKYRSTAFEITALKQTQHILLAEQSCSVSLLMKFWMGREK